VGQVVAEAIKLYQANFWRALALGIPVAVADQLIADRSTSERIVLLVAASPAFSLAYAAACAIRQQEHPPARVWALAVVVGIVTFLPAAALFSWFAIAAVLWLGIAGHAVPAVMAERLGPWFPGAPVPKTCRLIFRRGDDPPSIGTELGEPGAGLVEEFRNQTSVGDPPNLD